MKTKRIKRPVCYLVGLLAFGLMLYSCLQDETDLDSQETTGKVIKGKNRELSIDVARSWYEARQTPVVTTRSVVTHFELMTKLHWKKGYENRKGKFEVVEVPLLTRGGAVLMDRETMEKYKDTERGKIRNISRMVIIKNLETGEIINFVMHIVGTYDYLMKAKHFEDNSYLYRAPDLSGSVYFYEPEGGLVNGWQYKDGKIVATISQGTEEGLEMQANADTRSESSECHYESVFVEYDECTPFIYEDPEYGIGFGIECRTRTKYETKLVCNNIYYDKDGNSIPANTLSKYVKYDTADSKIKVRSDAPKVYDALGKETKIDVADISELQDLTAPLTVKLHVGADATANNQITINIASMSAKGLGVNGLKVDGANDTNALNAIDTIKESIQKVSDQRSALGAVQNRLEHTISNLDNVVENTTSAESRIRDTDMAEEMVNYSKNNILQQAGQSMLAQANQANQGVLSLLQ